jgi:serine/threonine protein kinase
MYETRTLGTRFILQAIDMWSLGCIMVELLTGTALFNGADEQDQVHRIVQVLGMPRDDLLQAASKRDRFFKLDRATGKYMCVCFGSCQVPFLW